MTFTYWLGYTLFKALARGFYNYRVIGAEKLHVNGGVLLVCNHASFLDPPIVGIAFDEPIHYLARKSLMKYQWSEEVLRACNTIPVDQSRPDMTGLKTVIRLLKSGEKVVLFPEGTRTPDGSLRRGEPGVGLIVAKAGVPVLPLRIYGTHEALPRGATMLHPSEITLVVGKLWHYDSAKYAALNGKDLYQAVSDELMEEIASINF